MYTDLKQLESIGNLLEEISILQRRSKLLEEILIYYNADTMTFDVPQKYKRSRAMSEEMMKKLPESPRHALRDKIVELMEYGECWQLESPY